MAFNLNQLTPVGGSARSGQTDSTDPENNSKMTWTYGSSDNLGTIRTAGYFNEVRDILNKNDTIYFAVTGQNFQRAFFLSAEDSPSTVDVTVSTLKNDAT